LLIGHHEVRAVGEWLEALLSWPLGSVTSIALVFGLMLVVTLPGSLVMNEERMKAYESEIKAWEEAKRRAILKKDRKMYERVLRRESRIRRLREEIEVMKLKAYGVSMAVWLLVLNLLIGAVGGVEVVYFPLLGTKLTLWSWYFILSFWLYSPASRVSSAISRCVKKGFSAARKR